MMKKDKIIKINLLINIAAVPNKTEAIEERRKKEKALKDICEKIEKDYKDNDKKVEISIVPYYGVEKRKKNNNDVLLLIDNEQYLNIEDEIKNAIEQLNNSFFERLFNRIKEIVFPDKITNINLFVICPKNALNDEKKQISDYCSKLNNNYAENGNKFKINTVTYYDPENREDVSNNYIKNKADIVLFLVDKITDDDSDPLVNNIKLAIDQNKTFQKPEPMVMVSKDSGKNTFKTTKKILASGGWIPDPFNNAQELLEIVEDKLKRYIDSYGSIRKARRKSFWRYYFLRIGLPIIIALAVGNGILWSKAESRRLLIVGGGSARIYIEESLLSKKNGLSTRYWIYTNMPSGEAYRLLSEENMNYTKDFDSLPYFPVIISAQKAGGDEAFCEINDEKKIKLFKDKGIVIGVYIGNDNLVVYGSNDAFDEIQIGQDSTITTKVLDSIIAVSKDSIMNKKTPPRMIYTTKNKSGTKNAYDSVCDNLIAYDSICDKLNIDHLFFNIDSITGHKTNNKWLTLGSEYYSPKENKYRLKVVNGDTLNIYKQMYVYFMMYKDGNNYKLPHATEGFLKEILKKTEVGDSVIKSIKNIEVTDKILYDNFSAIKQQ